MFNCDECVEKRELSITILKSYDTCEICGETTEYNNDSD